MRNVDKFANWIYVSIGIDGLLHILISLILTGFIANVSIPLALAAVGSISLIKEVYDMKTGGVFSWKDLMCDSIGIIIGLLI